MSHSEKTVLFSPIGGHDPMGNFSDGPMLRICRVYKPQKVYLFFSREMWEHHNQDNRYLYCLDKLCGELGVEIAHEEIFDENLVDVHLFDEFQAKFTELLTRVHSENPDSRLLVNISSGTPAMKSCLLFLSKMLPFEMTAVQVSTPERRQNPGEEDPKKIDIVTMWELNQDKGAALTPGDDPKLTRCHEEQYTNTLAQITKEAVCRHIDNYDYEAAIREAESIAAFVSPRAMELLRGAAERVRINASPLIGLLEEEQKKSLFPIQQSDMMPVFEYMLWLRMKVMREDIADFVRGITPALFNLSLRYLKLKVGIDLKKYVDDRDMLLRSKLEKTDEGRDILQYLDKRFPLRRDGKIILKNGAPMYVDFKDGYINSEICIYLISVYGSDRRVADTFAEIRDFETKIRHKIAHDIVKIDTARMKNVTGVTPSDIMNMLKYVASRTINIAPACWESYERMNELLKEEIKTGN